ncbi:pregnancy-associated plasma protein-A [bacterium BMS3Abin03]|nr:pregnancy-associated plasma protein-A [bacterium BMS3Abin03]
MQRALYFLIAVLFLSSFNLTLSQTLRCGTTDYMEQMMLQNPSWEEKLVGMEEQTQTIIQQNPSFLSTETITVIPVVVHVVYHTEEENISDPMIYSQIDVLNEDYRKMPGTNGWNNNPVGADTKYEFRMATVDPDGNPTDGITRTHTEKIVFGVDNTVKFNASGGHDAWPTNKYLNIWVCNLGDGYKGYSQFPGGDPATDGVVILYTAFGRPSSLPPYNYGRTTTHEIGHWLYLYHTFWNGCDPPGDFCSDTPYESEPNLGCPVGHISCGSIDMVENYMDYTDDICKNIFTNDQDNRMDVAVNVFRNELLVSYKETKKIDSTGVTYGFTDVNGNIYALLNFLDAGTVDSVTVEVWPDYYPPGQPENTKAVKRFFDFNSHGGDGFVATLKVFYKDSEVIGFENGDANLQLYMRNGSNWMLMGGIVDTTENSIVLSNVSQFGIWAIGDPDDDPIPVELTSFTASLKINSVTLNWITATEINNYGFGIERKLVNSSSGNNEEESKWYKTGFVPGHGTTTEQHTYSFTDDKLFPGSYDYRLRIIDFDGAFDYSNIVNVEIKLASQYSLNQNYPNPFNPTTKITYQIPGKGHVILKVFDILGNEIATLVNGIEDAGVHEIIFDASYPADGRQSLSSGIYFYTIFADGYTKTNKMILLK